MSSISVAALAGTDPAGKESGRKRALKACLACRSRKVRCDVSETAQPCTNCRLQAKNCLVVGRASRLAKEERRRDRTDSTSLQSSAPPVNEAELASFASDLVQPDSDRVRRQRTGSLIHDGTQFDGSPLDHTSHQSWESSMTAFDQVSGDLSLEQTESGASSVGNRPMPMQQASNVITYSHFRFLTVGNLHRIPSPDVNYLEAQGCLHVPMRPMLDDFVEQYFLHIHPLVPIIDEGDFWDMYAQTERNRGPEDSMALVFFQAMLFSSCTFVPFDTIKKLGFTSLRKARGEFYRRAKLLYDMETESSPLPLAQSALLLMGWVPPSNQTLIPYQTWLGRAVQHARTLDADRLARTADVETKRQKTLRRLWWCCVALDRISPLCTRFNPYIRRHTFDFEQAMPLRASDLKDEVYRSSVYNPASKKRLIYLFEIFMDLMVLLTDVLELVFPFREAPSKNDTTKIQELEAAMDGWFGHAMSNMPPFNEATPDQGKRQNLHKSVDSHVSLMYIYYYHARIAMHHFKTIHCLSSVSDAATRTRELEIIRDQLQDAVSNMTQIIASLNRRRLVRWLPISTLPCILIPLALSVVTARLSATNAGSTFEDPIQTRSSQENLTVLMEAIRSFFPQYDGVELIKKAVKHAADLAQTASRAHQDNSSPPPTTWMQILTNDPKSYLRMVISLDLAISKGRLAEEEDLPMWLPNKTRLDIAGNAGDNSSDEPLSKNFPHGAPHVPSSVEGSVVGMDSEPSTMEMAELDWDSTFTWAGMDGILDGSFWGAEGMASAASARPQQQQQAPAAYDGDRRYPGLQSADAGCLSVPGWAQMALDP